MRSIRAKPQLWQIETDALWDPRFEKIVASLVPKE
jgi:hypothetical protein